MTVIDENAFISAKAEIDDLNRQSYQKIMLHDQGRPELIPQIEKTLDLARMSNYRSGRYYALILLSANCMFLGDYEKGIDYVRQIDRDVLLRDETPFIQMLYYHVFMLYYVEHMGNLSIALDYGQLEVDAAEAFGDQKAIIRCRLHLAALSMDNGMYVTAEPLLLKAIKDAEAIKDPYLLVHGYANLGELLHKTKRVEESLDVYLKCLSHTSEGHYLPIQHGVTIELGIIEKENGRLENALFYLKKAERMEDQNIRLQEVFRRGHEQFLIYKSMNLIQEAKGLLSWLEKRLASLKNTSSAIQFHKDKAELSHLQENYKQAYLSMQESLMLTETFQSQNAAAKINQIIEDEHTKELSRLDALTTIGHEISTFSDIDEMIRKLYSAFNRFMSVDTIGIALLQNKELHYKHYLNDGMPVRPSKTSMSSDVSLAVWCAKNRESLLINDLTSDSDKYITRIGKLPTENDKTIQSVLFRPLIVNDVVLGVFTVQSYQKYAYTSVQERIHSIITEYLSIAINNVIQKDHLKALSIRDELTGLLNRRGLTEHYSQMLKQRSKDLTNISMLMLDLDHFKGINDTYGHDFGDMVLKATADVLRAYESPNILCSRVGGEEFCLLIISSEDYSLQEVAESIRRDVEALAIDSGTDTVKLTASIGAASEKISSDINYNLLYHKADKEMYQAKESGRNQVVIQPMVGYD